MGFYFGLFLFPFPLYFSCMDMDRSRARAAILRPLDEVVEEKSLPGIIGDLLGEEPFHSTLVIDPKYLSLVETSDSVQIEKIFKECALLSLRGSREDVAALKERMRGKISLYREG
jgi:hypothetical protein